MKFIRQTKTKTQKIGWLTVLLATLFLWSANAGDQSADATREESAVTPIRIVDQYGHPAPSGKPSVESEIFDVTVGPVEDEFSFVPDTVNISVGDRSEEHTSELQS